MTTATIHQPDFAPWLGFFDRLQMSDVYLVMDDVQFIRRGWHHRDKIKTAQDVQWLTLPIQKSGKFEQLISETLIDESLDWRTKHLKTLQCAYGKAQWFDWTMQRLEPVYNRAGNSMMGLNMDIIHMGLEILDIPIQVKFTSELRAQGQKTDRILDILRRANVDTYISGLGARAYLDDALIEDAGIRLVWQDFPHPVYPQLHGSFAPMLSCLDCFFNCGPDAAKVLRSKK
ncbi:MAG: hypothetical protein FD119_3510 [Stygiobacter sp.]|nr:MAG: hypothetical protein FD119_3510 [Stygiobacter sp.]